MHEGMIPTHTIVSSGIYAKVLLLLISRFLWELLENLFQGMLLPTPA